MKIRTRLTILFTCIAAAIVLVFALHIYMSAASDRRSEFYIQLQKEAMTRANLLLNTGIEAETLQQIYLENREILSAAEIAIYDRDFNLIYHDAEDLDFVKETPEMVNEIISSGEIRFVQEGWEVIGLLFQHDQQAYAVTAAAFDEYGYNKLINLRNSLLVSWVVSVVIIFLAGLFFARRALQPVSSMVSKAKEISATNLDLRLGEGNKKDELASLAMTFNRMLDRLEASFDSQKEFVSNISHELRTPLAAMIGELELALEQPELDQHNKFNLKRLLGDARRLNKLTNGLLDLAKASYQTHQMSMSEIRLDEILIDATEEVIKANSNCKIRISIDEKLEDESMVIIRGNAYLLRVAIRNIVENACKFSENKPVEARLYQDTISGKPSLQITDQGCGIQEKDMPHIFKPFFRASVTKDFEGSGIGLLLVQRILNLHHADIDIQSRAGEGTIVTISWP